MTMEKAKQICTEMLTQCGYNIISMEDEILKMLNKETNEPIVVFFDNQPKLNKGSISKYMSVMKDEGTTHSIIIYTDSVTNMTSKSVEQSIEMEIELFGMNELQFNITKHRLQPISFEVLGVDDRSRLPHNFVNKIPVMKRTDPISRFYNFKGGNIIQVTDRRGLINYRVVR
jgi:DNA-directed RNA polymerase subunit H (RpoH/RPB5)